MSDLTAMPLMHQQRSYLEAEVVRLRQELEEVSTSRQVERNRLGRISGTMMHRAAAHPDERCRKALLWVSEQIDVALLATPTEREIREASGDE